MKKKYLTPTIKIVEFQVELGVNFSNGGLGGRPDTLLFPLFPGGNHSSQGDETVGFNREGWEWDPNSQKYFKY